MFTVEPTKQFEREYKRIIKKYPKSKETFEDIFEELEKGNLIGDEYPDLGLPADEMVCKIKAANVDANKGKSGGFRIIYYAVINNEWIYLLSIYSKSDTTNVKQSEIKEILKGLL